MPYVMVENNHDHDDGRDKYRHDKYDCDDDRRRWWSHNRNGAEREPPGSNFETKRGTGTTTIHGQYKRDPYSRLFGGRKSTLVKIKMH